MPQLVWASEINAGRIKISTAAVLRMRPLASAAHDLVQAGQHLVRCIVQVLHLFCKLLHALRQA